MRQPLPLVSSDCIQRTGPTCKTLLRLSIYFLFVYLAYPAEIEATGSNSQHCRKVFFTLSAHSDLLLPHLDSEVQRTLEAELQNLTKYQQWVFIRALRKIRELPSGKPLGGDTTHGILGVRIAKYLQNHPAGRIMLVHESVHLRELISAGVPFRIRDFLRKRFVRDIVIKMEIPAYEAHYDFIHQAFSRNDLLRYRNQVAEGVDEMRALHLRLQSKHILDGDLNLIDTRPTRTRIRKDSALQKEIARLMELTADDLLYRDLKDAFSLSRDEFVSSRIARYEAQIAFQTEVQKALKLSLIASIPVGIFAMWMRLQSPQEDDESSQPQHEDDHRENNKAHSKNQGFLSLSP